MKPRAERRAGWAWALLAVTIWASWFAVTSHGVRGTLATADVALIRVAVPALLLAAPLWAARERLARLRPGDVLGLGCYGLPFVVLVAAGLARAPVSHAVALVPGFMPVLAGVWTAVGHGVRHPPRRLAGFALMLAGAVAILATGGGGDAVGHACLLAASGCLAAFTLTARRLALPPFVATGLVGAVSAVLYLPVYVVWPLGALAYASWWEIGVQVLVQGLLAGVVAVYAYARAIRRLGVATASASVALVPPAATVVGWLGLGERPGAGEMLAVLACAAGVFAASDARLRRRGRAETG